jgi:ATP-dependent exoDNAse (exonuclease V) beta subunit
MTALVDHDARVHALSTFDRNLLVEAGAGSGKTALMAGRIALLLASGVTPANIAAITFTELAAAELADRVQRFVHQLLAGEVDVALRAALPDGLAPEQRAHLTAAAERLDDLTCTTIHGFAHDLIRPYPSEADVDPGASVLDPDAAELLRTDVFRDWLHTRLGADGDAQPDDAVAAWLLHDGARDATVKCLRDLAAIVESAPEVRVHAPGPSVVAAFDRVAGGVAAFERLTRNRPSPPKAHDRAAALSAYVDCLAADRHRPAYLAAATLAAPKSGLYDDAFTKECSMRAFGLKGAWKKLDPMAGAEAEELYDLIRDDMTALHQAAADHLLAGVARDLPEVGAAYRERKRRAALIDFDDMLDVALAMLRRHDEVRRALAQRYRFVLIDEFQDTDPRQAEIVWRLTGEPREPDDPWERWPSRPGARFVVGDPKQAIYRFRGADVETYLRLRDQWDGDLLRVRVNFRSLPDILEHANRAFAAPLTNAGQPGYDDLAPHREAAANPAVRHLHVPHPRRTVRPAWATCARPRPRPSPRCAPPCCASRTSPTAASSRPATSLSWPPPAPRCGCTSERSSVTASPW